MIALEYPKIETLYNRDKETFRVIEGQFRCPEFALIKPDRWFFQEKIDGMNIRIQWDGENVEIGGRTNNAQLPGDLVANLTKAVKPEAMRGVFPDANPLEPVILFGEGYGPGIQKEGGLYRPDKGFILFDVRVGQWWLEWDKVCDVAYQLDCFRVNIYEDSLDNIITALKEDSLQSKEWKRERKAEGVILRTWPTLHFRHGGRVIAKLKAVDFKHGKR